MRILLLIAAASYLLGSIPFGYLLVRIFRGEDVRDSGSGNIGATNVSRKSPTLGILTLFLDALKGTCAVLLANVVFMRIAPGNVDVSLYAPLSLVALCAILGHMFPVWLRFRGGKGVATSVGAFALLIPRATLGAFAIFVIVALISRYVSLASIAAAVSLPILAWISLRHRGGEGLLTFLPIAIASVLVIAKHHENIRRLLAGTENRFGSRHA
ncbi:MAG TPA: glycerol-3-phosphate 1-O-acyltransferase PlsY [Candidatus Dormibacteraeota bacterium]|nr:glycerol-3-phosphate 1-O-acyltransferase PlsY [Candidatus Dormibacteraeota bacterium]